MGFKFRNKRGRIRKAINQKIKPKRGMITMSKIKITGKEIKNRFNKILSTGYCNMYYLLRGHDPTYYNYGVYGWNYDVYIINDIAIVTGYRTFKGNMKNEFDIINDYETKARDTYKVNHNTDETDTLLNELLEKLEKIQ
jgi:hypothetical protein